MENSTVVASTRVKYVETGFPTRERAYNFYLDFIKNDH